MARQPAGIRMAGIAAGRVAAEQQIRACVAESRALGKTWDQIADQLNADGLKTRSGVSWTAPNVGRVMAARQHM